MINKDENHYSELILKNKEEVNSKSRAIANLETKIYELGKENTEKKKDIDDYIEKNAKLNSTINKLNQLKGEMEYEITLVKDKERDDEVKKYKSIIEEMDSQFKKIIMDKDQSFLNDMTTLDSKYNNVI